MSEEEKPSKGSILDSGVIIRVKQKSVDPATGEVPPDRVAKYTRKPDGTLERCEIDPEEMEKEKEED